MEVQQLYICWLWGRIVSEATVTFVQAIALLIPCNCDCVTVETKTVVIVQTSFPFELFERRGTVSGRSQLQELLLRYGGYGDEGHTVQWANIIVLIVTITALIVMVLGVTWRTSFHFSSDLVQTNRKLPKCTSYLTIGNQTRLNCNVANMKKWIWENPRIILSL